KLSNIHQLSRHFLSNILLHTPTSGIGIFFLLGRRLLHLQFFFKKSIKGTRVKRKLACLLLPHTIYFAVGRAENIHLILQQYSSGFLKKVDHEIRHLTIGSPSQFHMHRIGTLGRF
ncbi:hypothetical protein CFOL_v3_31640, partial [Cephalotus follicularis]